MYIGVFLEYEMKVMGKEDLCHRLVDWQNEGETGVRIKKAGACEGTEVRLG